MATLIASGLPVEGERGVGYILSSPITLPPCRADPRRVGGAAPWRAACRVGRRSVPGARSDQPARQDRRRHTRRRSGFRQRYLRLRQRRSRQGGPAPVADPARHPRARAALAALHGAWRAAERTCRAPAATGILGPRLDADRLVRGSGRFPRVPCRPDLPHSNRASRSGPNRAPRSTTTSPASPPARPRATPERRNSGRAGSSAKARSRGAAGTRREPRPSGASRRSPCETPPGFPAP